MNKDFKTAIIGSGPAGLTAAIYLARAYLNPTLFTGRTFGGQLMLTTEVENYPGFPEGIMGPELIDKMTKQAKKFGTKMIYDDVIKVNYKETPFKIFTEKEEFTFDGIIIATGASAKWLNLKSEQVLIGKGVSSCATCDGAFFKNKEIAVVGGGDTAMEEAIFLTKFASKVYLIHRRDEFRASKIMIDKALANEKITPLYNTEVIEVLGENKVTGIKIKDSSQNKESTIELSGLFIAIGHQPNTSIFKDQIELNDIGYILLKDRNQTSIKGIYSAGDVDDTRYRQIVTAAAEGCKAALDLEKYLEGIE